MDIRELLDLLIQIVIIPAVPIIATYLVGLLKKLTEEVAQGIASETTARYLSMISDVVSQAVMATTQTYVDRLKEQEAFDEEAQRIAFTESYNKVVSMLSDELLGFIKSAYGDVEAWLTTRIEQEVALTK